MPKNTINYLDDLHERLKDPAYAYAYLRATMSDAELFEQALRDTELALRDADWSQLPDYLRERLKVIEILSALRVEAGEATFSVILGLASGRLGGLK